MLIKIRSHNYRDYLHGKGKAVRDVTGEDKADLSHKLHNHTFLFCCQVCLLCTDLRSQSD